MCIIRHPSLTLCVIALLLGGCATPTHYVDSNGSLTALNDTNINQQDWNTAAEALITQMQNDFINRGNLQSADGPGRPAIMVISRVVNNTSKQVDTDLLIKRIRIALQQTGKILTDVTGGLAGAEDPLIDEWKRKQLFENGGKVRPPDYSLSGKISEDYQRSGRTKEVTYTFQLTLASSQGIAVWEGEKRITKQTTRAVITAW